jgi:hypothetical protein
LKSTVAGGAGVFYDRVGGDRIVYSEVTMAPGTTLPVGSRTEPVSAPVPADWAGSGGVSAINPAIANGFQVANLTASWMSYGLPLSSDGG